MQKNSVKKLPILIVGAGPVGMTLGLYLAQQGVLFAIIDKRPEPTSMTRGIAINQATLATFDEIGIGKKIETLGLRITELKIYYQKKMVGKIHFKNLPILRPYFFHLEQNKIEYYLAQQLEASGIPIARSHELIQLTQTGDKVRTTVNAAGKLIDYESSFVIGCDGGSSDVRTLSGISFDAQIYGGYFVLADVVFHGLPFTKMETHYYLTPSGYAMLVPIPHGRYRVIFSFSDAYQPEKIEVTPVFIAEWLIKRTGLVLSIQQITWSTHAPFGHRVAMQVHQDRVVLAGDALHQFSPIGGTNMNMGIQDAAQLGKLLPQAVKNPQSTQWLKGYAIERLQLIKQHLLSTQYVTRLMVRAGSTYRGQRPWYSSTLSQLFDEELPWLLTGYAKTQFSDANFIDFQNRSYRYA